MILYHPDGQPFYLAQSTWRRALCTAHQRGWKPSGTLPPPRSLLDPATIEWRGGYAQPTGQGVNAIDAANLGTALMRAKVEGSGPEFTPEMEQLAKFCRAGGFIICREPDVVDDLIALARHLSEPGQVIEKTTPIPK